MCIAPSGPRVALGAITDQATATWMSNPIPEIEAPEHPQALLAPPPGSTPKSEPPKAAPEKPVRRKRLWLYLGLLALIILVAIFFWSRSSGAPAATQKAVNGKGGRGAPAVTPVVAFQAETGNIGVYVTGLGAITPIYTVTVKS